MRCSPPPNRPLQRRAIARATFGLLVIDY
jgi:hypothetical protein